MPHTITISDQLFTRLQALAVPLVDSIETVIERAVCSLEGSVQPAERHSTIASTLTFDAASPPDLSFTMVRSARVNDRQIPRGEANWNAIMLEVLRAAAARGVKGQALLDMCVINSKLGQHETGGFKYVDGGGVSVQGQSANGAWRQISATARALNIQVEVAFGWSDVPRAKHPGRSGLLRIGSET